MKRILFYVLWLLLPLGAWGQEVLGVDFQCTPEVNCEDGIDEDGDGLIDCDDLDCLIKTLDVTGSRNSSTCPPISIEVKTCILSHTDYFEELDVISSKKAIEICKMMLVFDPNFAGEEPKEIQNGIKICDAFPVNPSPPFERGPLIASTIYRHPHAPPDIIAPDMAFGTDGDEENVHSLIKSRLDWSDEDLFSSFESLVENTSTGGYQTIGYKYIDQFRENVGETYQEKDLSGLIIQEIVTRNFMKKFGELLSERLADTDVKGNIEILENNILNIPNSERVRFINLDELSRTAYYVARGPVILANDTELTSVHKQSFNFNAETGDWDGIFYVELLDHFGLDDNDIERYQLINPGFASWWILQHLRNYQPFLTKIGFIMCLEGNVSSPPLQSILKK